MDLNKATYNRIAEDWLKDHKDDVWSVQGAKVFAGFLKPGDSVLDCGCGPGIKAKVFARRGFTVTGIDFSERMIAVAEREVPEGIFRVIDVRDVSALTEQFDGIFAQAVLLHIPREEVVPVLEGLMKKLKSGGYFYCAVKEKKAGQPDKEIKSDNDYGYTYERFFSYFTLDEILVYMQQLGLEIARKEILPFGNTRWIQVIAKKPLKV